MILERTAVLAAIMTLLTGRYADADVRDYLGRLLVDVRVEVNGEPYEEPSVLQLIETRIGEPLSMQQVRESIDHLIGLGRFEDVRVFAAHATNRPESVTLRWVLVPVQRIARIEIRGAAVFSDNTLREVLTERVGAQPVTSRVAEIEQALRAYYTARGYRRPVVESTLSPGEAPELATLALTVTAGPRTVIGDVAVKGDAGQPTATVVAELDLTRGSPYDATELTARIEDYANSLRALGHYEANVEVTEEFADEGATVRLTVDVERGPLVRVVFAGDPLPENRRDSLVPIRQERSVDLDLLEDASRNIEDFLRQEGYRSAEAPYVREEKDGEMVLTFTVARGPLHRLATLDVRGHEQITRADIEPLLALKAGEPFAEQRITTVAAAITELYRVRGFARATVKPDIIVRAAAREAGQETRAVAVTIVINEGPRTVVGEVGIGGTAAIQTAQITPLLRLTPGRPFYRPQLDADRDAIERLYRNEGFRDVRAVAQTTLSDDLQRLDVHWAIAEGQRTLVDRVLVSGNVRTSADLIRREISLQTGSPLSDELIIDSQRRLAELGLFRRVRIVELPHSGSLRRDVLIEIEEAPATTIDYGGGLEAGRRARPSDDSQATDRIDIAPRAFFQISRRNLWGKNRSVTLFTRASLRPRDPGVDESDQTDEGGYGVNEYRVVGTFREPRVFDRAGDLFVTAFLEQAIRTSFNFRRRGVRVDYGRRVLDVVTLTGRYSFDHTRLFDVQIPPEEQPLVDRLFPQVRLSMITGGVLRDTRNDVIDPDRGTLSGVETSLSLRALGSELGFAKALLQGFLYRRLPGDSPYVVAAGARVGWAHGFEGVLEGGTDLNDVPASERFFAGGASTVRGFVLDRLGMPETINSDGFPEGGRGLVVTNLELRTPYWKGVGAVAFLDSGNVFQRASDIRLTDLRAAAGLGLRYRSPLGPLRVDVGFNLDPQTLPNGTRERTAVFHLSLGQAF
jgi:outer membrane protein assembly complex protein YaeT